MVPIKASFAVIFGTWLVSSAVQHVATAEEASYRGFDTTKFMETLKEIPDPVSDVERVTELRRLLDDYARRSESKEIIAALDENARRWKTLSKQLDDELAEAKRQAHTDAELRSVARLLNLAAVTASTYGLLTRHPDPSPAGGSLTPDPASGQSNQTDGDVPHEEHIIRVRMDGQWRTISIERILFRGHAPPEDDDPILRNILGQINQWADELPSLTCDTKRSACSTIPSYSPHSGSEATSRNPDTREQPTDMEQDVFNTIMSIGLDLTPVGDGWRLATGKDPLTGERVSRIDAGVWLAVGAVGGPVGKGVLKSAKNLWKLGLHKSGTKWVRQFSKRGWTPDLVDEAVLKGRRIEAENYVNPRNSATRYEYGKRSVVIDDETTELLHVGKEGFDYERVR